jgi:hypothetical protein
MVCPNFKNGPKTGLHPLGVKIIKWYDQCLIVTSVILSNVDYTYEI